MSKGTKEVDNLKLFFPVGGCLTSISQNEVYHLSMKSDNLTMKFNQLLKVKEKHFL